MGDNDDDGHSHESSTTELSAKVEYLKSKMRDLEQEVAKLKTANKVKKTIIANLKEKPRKPAIKVMEEKKEWKNPRLPICSTTLVTVYDKSHGLTNIIAISDIVVCCYIPLYISMSIRPQRYSHKLVMETLEFCINIPGTSLLQEVDLCGNYSGRNINKFEKFGLMPIPCRSLKKTMAVQQCYGHIECRIIDPKRHIIHLGEHTVFIGKVIDSWANKDAIDENGQVKLEFVKPIIYVARQRRQGYQGKYRLIGKEVGHQGFSIESQK